MKYIEPLHTKSLRGVMQALCVSQRTNKPQTTCYNLPAMKRPVILLALLLALLWLIGYSFTAQASAPAQGGAFSTPTPLPDGRIIYIVQPGDSCFRISALTGIPIEQIRSLNRLGEDCALREGQELLLGIGGPSGATPTAEAAITPTPEVQPTPTAPLAGEAQVCVVFYNDLNGDALRQDTEPLLAGGALSISGASGQFSQTANTPGGTEPVCFERVPEGNYNISIAPPENYNPTTQLNHTLTINAGEQVEIIFGAQQAIAELPTEPEQGSNGPGSLLGILGVGFLLAGLGLGVFAWRFYGRKPTYTK
ncbi:MAG: hypothetical protein DDG60_07140 [Anaerolineae bacterium]|nr:MAG: hypothetical protein DDG60_07140 [Anaerolineae bacterium]